MCGVVKGELVVKLETGDIARFQKRDGISDGDRVLVGYDFENMKVGHIILDGHAVLRDKQKPGVKSEQPDEDLHGRMNSFQLEDLGSLSQGDEEFEELEVDDFEVLRFLSQGSGE